jgi:hypothetical protein
MDKVNSKKFRFLFLISIVAGSCVFLSWLPFGLPEGYTVSLTSQLGGTAIIWYFLKNKIIGKSTK